MSCSYYQALACHSCDWISLSYQEQLQKKEAKLSEMVKIHLEDSHLSRPWGFRDKVKMIVGGNLDAPIIGIMKNDLTTFQEILGCPLQQDWLTESLQELKSFIQEYRLTPYLPKTRTGELKSLILFRSPTTGEAYLRFVLRSREPLDRIRKGLSKLTPRFKVVSCNLQPIPHAILEGPEEILMTEEKFITHSFNKLQFSLSTQSFVQTNTVVAEALYQTATEWVSPLYPQEVFDLYCGIGAFSLHLKKAGLPVTGVEINPHAVDNAKTSAKLNRLQMDFFASPSEGISDLFLKKNPDLVVVNPPRQGLRDTLPLLLHHLPQTILYSSCNPDSLAADLQKLQQQYIIKKAKIFDMFPQTHHFESLILLTRKTND